METDVDLRRIDLNHLVILDALFEEPTLTRAAQRLQLSQPTVSTALARLRDLLGDELFVRSRGVMNATPLAVRLREPLSAVLRSIRHDILAQSNFDARTTRDTFTISLSDIGELEFLPVLMERLSAEAPNAHVKSISCNPEVLADAMDAGEIDLAIGYFPDLKTSVFKQQVLFNHASACIVRKDHPDFAQGISLDQYRNARHIAVEQQSRHHDVIELALIQQDIHRDVALTISHYVNVPALVADSNLVATLARPLARRFAELFPVSVLDVPFAIPMREIKQVWHRRFDNDPRLVWLRALIASMSQNRPHL
jgi:DNA-binding transcriptional LysR family regulator